MKLYFYESHLDGIYVSERDDLDIEICEQCGDSDIMLTSCDTDEFEELFYAFCDLLKFRMCKKDFEDICKDLKSFGLDIDLERDYFINLCKEISE
ncbi:hypothetical protein EQF93_02610 [Helcococcus ovis]|uniref:hypothetical protein n=1 Tax=Helcococcus ovis TaxID=72026 RepID=UPI0010702BE3|nr:hypothetical protein [Helcococcus ovis]TFF68347.1 hypothetical protein EQF93_02610 [Helcococcus ovis]WNZ00898.1 hypothetical protein EQF90_006430 [Helcococcus ovis]